MQLRYYTPKLYLLSDEPLAWRREVARRANPFLSFKMVRTNVAM